MLSGMHDEWRVDLAMEHLFRLAIGMVALIGGKTASGQHKQINECGRMLLRKWNHMRKRQRFDYNIEGGTSV